MEEGGVGFPPSSIHPQPPLSYSFFLLVWGNEDSVLRLKTQNSLGCVTADFFWGNQGSHPLKMFCIKFSLPLLCIALLPTNGSYTNTHSPTSSHSHLCIQKPQPNLSFASCLHTLFKLQDACGPDMWTEPCIHICKFTAHL